MERTIIAYIAGLIDGEGTITIYKSVYGLKKGTLKCPQFCEKVMIGMNATKENISVLKFIKENFGGVLSIEKKIYSSPASIRRGIFASKPRVRYIAMTKVAVNLLKKIYPFLRIKKAQADVVFLLRKSINKTWERRRNQKSFSTLTLDSDTIEYREKLWEKIKAMHH